MIAIGSKEEFAFISHRPEDAPASSVTAIFACVWTRGSARIHHANLARDADPFHISDPGLGPQSSRSSGRRRVVQMLRAR